MKSLILGSSGFLGSYFKVSVFSQNLLFLERNYENKFVLIGDGNLLVKFESLNLVDIVSETLETYDIKAIINCVAMISAEACEYNPTKAFDVNSEIPKKISRIAKKFNVKFVQISTDAVFAQTGSGFKPDTIPMPRSVYGKSKLLGESYVRQNSEDNLIVRTNFFGYSETRLTLFNYFYNAFHNNNEAVGYSNQIFSPIYIEDLIASLFALLEKDARGTIHLGGKEKISKHQLGSTILNCLKKPSRLLISQEYENLRDGPYRNLDISLDSSKTLSILDDISDIKTGVEKALALAFNN